MQILLTILVLGIIVIVLLPSFKKNIQHTETIKSLDLEEIWVELKREILVTDAYTDESKYNRLYYRCKEVLSRILERHRHLTLDIEAKHFTSTSGSNLFPLGFAATSAFRNETSINNIESHLLFYMAFNSYLGGDLKELGVVEANPKFFMRALDFLITERDYPPAKFLKGLILKYGVTVYTTPDIESASHLLGEAQALGVGSAAIELRQIQLHAALSGIKSVQLGAERYAWK